MTHMRLKPNCWLEEASVEGRGDYLQGESKGSTEAVK